MYKRQTVDYSILMTTRYHEERAFGRTPKEAAQQSLEHCSQSIPVSYTHLDVYKRQVLISHFFSRKGNALRILWLLPIIAIQILSLIHI